MHRKINVNVPCISQSILWHVDVGRQPSREFKVPANPRERLEHSAKVFTLNPNRLDGFQRYTPIPARIRRFKLNNKNRIADGVYTKLPGYLQNRLSP